MSIATKTWVEQGTTVRVLTTEQDGLSPATAAVDAVIRSLDSTQKARSADRAVAAALRAARHGGVLVSLDMDIATAGDAPAGGWQVPVGEPGRGLASADLDRIAIRTGALATTRATEASPWQSITVAARTCLHADAAASAAISKDDGAIAWLQQHRLAARLVETDGTIHYIGTWPDPESIAA